MVIKEGVSMIERLWCAARFRTIAFAPADFCGLVLSLTASLSIFAASIAAQAAQEPKKSSDEELGKQLNNPIASLISVPFANLGTVDGGILVSLTRAALPDLVLGSVICVIVIQDGIESVRHAKSILPHDVASDE